MVLIFWGNAVKTALFKKKQEYQSSGKGSIVNIVKNERMPLSKVDSPEWRELVAQGARAMEIDVNDTQLDQLCAHAVLLLQWNRKMNITAITDPCEMAIKHYVDAMVPIKYISPDCSLLDIGSGGGFPGMVLKIMMPSLHVTLIDASRKKIGFLKYAVHHLGLDTIEAHHVRGEHLPGCEFAERKFDVAISRAFAALDVFTPMALPMLAENGVMLAMKGKRIDEELKTLDALNLGCHAPHGALTAKEIFDIDVIRYRLPVLNSRRSLVIIKTIHTFI